MVWKLRATNMSEVHHDGSRTLLPNDARSGERTLNLRVYRRQRCRKSPRDCDNYYETA